MKKIILSAAIAIISVFATTTAAVSAENAKPDKLTIQTQIANGNYARLMEKFKSGQQLTAEEAATIYYGSALQPGFNAEKQYTAMLEAYNSGNTEKAFKLCEEALEKDPTNLGVLFKAYASAVSSKDAATKAKAPVMQTRLLAICDAIFASGTGVRETSPYVVIRPADIEEFLVKYMQPQSIEGHANVGELFAAKVRLEGIEDDVILYFATF